MTFYSRYEEFFFKELPVKAKSSEIIWQHVYDCDFVCRDIIQCLLSKFWCISRESVSGAKMMESKKNGSTLKRIQAKPHLNLGKLKE